MDIGFISLIIFLPLAGIPIILLLPDRSGYIMRRLVTGIFGIEILLSLIAFYAFNPVGDINTPNLIYDWMNLSFYDELPWISMDLGVLGELNISYSLGIDGLSIWLIILTSFIMLIATLASHTIKIKLKGFYVLILLLGTTIFGCFAAMDLFLFFLFFEFMLLPMYFLIGLWGGPRKEYAAIKFFLYTLAGSMMILVVMIGLYVSAIDPIATGEKAGLIDIQQPLADQVEVVQSELAQGNIEEQYWVRTFKWAYLTDTGNYIPNSIFSSNNFKIWGESARNLAFLALFIGFLIKLPGVPFHTWLPDAHVEAPTPISVILAALLLKVGGYGILRMAYSIFPEGATQYGYVIGVLGVISIIYAALVALASKDLKKMIAYSSVSHMGFFLLGIASLTNEGFMGANFQLFSHGLISAMLFLIAGVVYSRTHDRTINHYGGLAKKMPKYTFFVVIAFFASLGLPGFSGFIAEIFVFLGGFSSSTENGILPRSLVIIAAIGLILTAGYYLWTLQRMFFGKFYYREQEKERALVDLEPVDYLMFTPLAIAILFFGLFPQIFIDGVAPTVEGLINHIMSSSISK
ncbi:NADH-quinone oxidoreductase subunit M [Mangrovivirga sp. M17]|uniref:NADH-quinone oxidoreductase subunit M n=1 Tax=Mangrovivirga halotolerans TaxID=2993936 RepID=A0ABT3RPI6_9BACT|nr:NADH-quinone oxidoreductase subunit M [Mangrovivirga halotolerans]MCX2743520.1 NADH-quinone oxidoreductase subunit M [Mangrovivirga halotolerans]